MSSVRSVKGRQPIIGPARLYSGPIPLAAASYEGAWAYSDGRMAYSDGTQWQELISNVSTLLTKTVGGTNPDFTTLGAAIAYFAGFSPTAAQFDFLGKIVIRNAHTVTDQTLVRGQDLGWVAIESETLSTVSVERTSNVSTVEFSTPHGLAIGRTFALTGCTDSSFDILSGTVTGVPSTTKIEYSQTASNVSNTADTTGVCYADIDVDVSGWAQTDPFLVSPAAMPLMSFVGGSAPIINCRFKRIGTAPTDPATSAPYKTIGLALRTCTFATLTNSAISDPPGVGEAFKAGLYGFAENVRVGSQSLARITAMELSGASIVNLVASQGSAAVLFCRVRGSTGTNNMLFTAASLGAVFFTDYQTTQGSNATTDVTISLGSIVSIGSTALGGFADPEVVPNQNGIIFDDRASAIPVWPGFIKPESYTVATLPSASTYSGTMIYVSNETGGATIAFSDGANWRRVQDRNIVS